MSTAILCAVLSHRVAADTLDSAEPMLLFSGFGTLGLVHSSEHGADFTTSVFKPNGAGYTHAWSGDVDSVFGAQVNVNISPKLSAMVQVIAEQRYDNTYTPLVQWANIKYQPLPDFSVRIGRIVLRSFLVSDSHNVGYANLWVRPPIEVYALVPISKQDGVDATYSRRAGPVTNTVTGAYGSNDAASVGGGRSTSRHQWNIADTIEVGALTVHLAYQENHLTIDGLNDLIDAFRHFGAQGNAIADQYDQKDKPLWFAGVGAMYDPGDWFLTGEWGESEFHSVLGKHTGWYVSGGHRWASLTPYLTYAATRAQIHKLDPGLAVAGLPPALAGQASGLNAALNSILGSIASQKTTSAGVRWDFARDMDFKVQFDRIRLDPHSSGWLTNVQPDFRPGGTVNVFSLAVDFVF